MGAREDEVRVVLQRPAFGEREKDAVAGTAEKRKGSVRSLASGVKTRFVSRVGYVDKDYAASEAARIEGRQR